MKKSYFYAAISILFWSTIATVSKLLLKSLGSFEVLTISTAFAGLTLFVSSLLGGGYKKYKTLKLKDIIIMILIGLPGTFFYNAFYYLGTEKLLASQAFIINYLWPIMSVVFAVLLLKEKMTIRKGVAIFISFLGVITVAGDDLINFNADSLLGTGLCILAAVSYGAFCALNKKWHYDKQISLALSFLSTALISLIINLAMGSRFSFGLLETIGLAYNGIFVLAIATTTWALALDLGDTAKISNLAYITPFASLIWTSVILNESISVWSVAGLVIIVLGIIIQLGQNGRKIEP